MKTSGKRIHLSWISIVVAAVAAIGIAYSAVFVFGKSEGSQMVGKAPAPATPRASKPPKVEFLGATRATGSPMMPPSGQGDPAEAYSDDAMVLWFKLTSDGPIGRGNRPRLMVTDGKGAVYSTAPERRTDGLVALHLQQGYSSNVRSLKVSASTADTDLGSWEFKNIPPPPTVFPDSTVERNPPGEVVMHPGRGNRPVVQLELKPLAHQDMGAVLIPIAESHAKFDAKRFKQPFLAVPGDPPLRARFPIPDPTMNKGVQFDMTTFKADPDTEVVTFHNVSLEDRFGQPTFVATKSEKVVTPHGDTITLAAQDAGPKRAPHHVHPRAEVSLSFRAASPADSSVAFISTAVTAEIVSPTLASLGLESAPVSLIFENPGDANAFHMANLAVKSAAGAFHYGPINELTVKFTILRPKALSKRRVTMPITSSTVPIAGPSGGFAGATPQVK